jgi:hypothetical protein
LRECGQLEFDVLLYHFEPGMKLIRFPCGESHPEAFVLTSRSLYKPWFGDVVVRLSGYAYTFNGDEYERRSVRTDIEKFEGTIPIQCLPAMELPAQIEEALKSTCGVFVLINTPLMLLQNAASCTRLWRVFITKSTRANASWSTSKHTITGTATLAILTLL